MKDIGIGIDIEKVNRFSANPYEKNKRFYNIIFNQEEIENCLSKPNPYQSFAARFSAKEALIKAVPQHKISFKEIVISSDKIPKMSLAKRGLENIKVKLSLSHTDENAVAFVIVRGLKN